MATIGITMGDPAGIGPEITHKALQAASSDTYIVFGAPNLLGGVPPNVTVLGEPLDIVPGMPTLESARAQVSYLREAARLAADGTLDAIVTAPISKEQVHGVGFPFPGHTEFFADAFGVTEYAMMFWSPMLIVALATTHIPLRDVASALHSDLIVAKSQLLASSLERLHGRPPTIGVVGLNPHAGEAGLLGSEEGQLIAPALSRLESLGVNVKGPLVPDVAFRDCASGKYDGLLAMYHDQGLIPVKLLGFEQSVNVTIGLPIVRTSPDHGVAYDIAGKDLASPKSMAQALSLAQKLCRQ